MTIAQNSINENNRDYKLLQAQYAGLIEVTANRISRMSTLAALLHSSMPQNSWTGFYLCEDGELIVGPFQGPVACLKLRKDTGVCWAAVNSGKAQVVPDVHAFPGHIACDAASCSEVVVPCRDKAGNIYAVLDIDSYKYNSYNETDASELARLVEMICL
ncbi:MAG: GAF domain-containing protein [Sedimentisphaerales bacterium]|nr:GAF domain-containing protein [Sedimentisphaerales bacterium]MBN2843748.1 GAF domain-containing protein [Sedimentisphaerales bacterium]